MTDGTKMPQNRPQHEKTNNPKTDELLINGEGAMAVPDNPAWRIKRPSPWPYRPEDSSTLAWWRRLPSDSFHDSERFLVLATLKQISVLHAEECVATALGGDPAAAIGVAFSLMPMEEINLRTDIAMTALLRCALDRNAAAALVLAQVLGLSDLGHPFATELAASWYTHGLRHSTNPRKFSEAEATLLAAFRERDELGRSE
jgi:hypothetical protein